MYIFGTVLTLQSYPSLFATSTTGEQSVHEPIYSHSVAGGTGIHDVLPAWWDSVGYFTSTAQHPIQLWTLGLLEEPADTAGQGAAKVAHSFICKDNRLERFHPTFLTRAVNGKPWLIAAGGRFVRIFDIESGSADPFHNVNLSDNESKTHGSGISLRALKGQISCTAAGPYGLLATGTYEGQVGIFADDGVGELTCVLDESSSTTQNSATIQVKWSQARPWYLYVAKRQTDSVQVYDARHFGPSLNGLNTALETSRLFGRKNATNQRLSFDLFSAGESLSRVEDGVKDGEWLVAGGTGGQVVGWKDPWGSESKAPDFSTVVGTDAITAVVAHPDGSLVTGSSKDRYRAEIRHWWQEEASSDSDDTESEDSSEVIDHERAS